MDRLIIIPSSIPPHKTAGKLVPAEHRLEMCNLAFGSDPKVTVSPIEIERSGKSYTVDTLRELKKLYPDDELFFIFGSDMLETFTQWYRWEEILSLAKICACSRENGFVPSLDEYTQEQKERILFMNIPPLELSSTQVRNLTGDALREKVSVNVADYIEENRLYDDGLSEYRELLQSKLDSYRLFHSECVSECAAVLAEKYGADPQKARLAGLLHDVTKNSSAAEHLLYCDNLTAIEAANTKVWHQISGEGFLRENKIIEDEEILAAVRWHTTGRAGMSLLEKIVYVADFISADRDYADVETVRKLASISLEHAILYTSRYTVQKLSSKDMFLHPATVDCYNDMLLHFGLQKG